MKSRPLTSRQLRAAFACNSQQKLFVELFGKEVKVTEAKCVKHATDFQFAWAIRHLLPYGSPGRDQALAKLERVESSNWNGRMSYARYKRRCAVIFARAYLTPAKPAR